MQGRVIGLNAFLRNDLAGLGFAIGINRVCEALEGLVAAAEDLEARDRGGRDRGARDREVEAARSGTSSSVAPSRGRGGEELPRAAALKAKELLEAQGIIAPPAKAAGAAGAAEAAEVGAEAEGAVGGTTDGEDGLR